MKIGWTTKEQRLSARQGKFWFEFPIELVGAHKTSDRKVGLIEERRDRRTMRTAELLSQERRDFLSAEKE